MTQPDDSLSSDTVQERNRRASRLLVLGFGLLPLWLFAVILIGVGPMMLWYLIPAAVLCLPTLGIVGITHAVYRRTAGSADRRFAVARNAFLGLLVASGAIIGVLVWRYQAQEREYRQEKLLAQLFVEESEQVAAAAGGKVKASLSATRMNGNTPVGYFFSVTGPTELMVDVKVARDDTGPRFTVRCMEKTPTGPGTSWADACKP